MRNSWPPRYSTAYAVHLQERAGVIALGCVVVLLNEVVDVEADRSRSGLDVRCYWRNHVKGNAPVLQRASCTQKLWVVRLRGED